MKKDFTNIAVLGSTGSIGRQTLDIIKCHPDHFKVLALAGGSNITLLEKQIQEHNPAYVYGIHKPALPPHVQYLPIEEIAALPEVDLVVIATSGKAGLAPTLAALRAGKKIAIANKEVLVMAGHIVSELAIKHGATLLPVDSEHSAIWQCLNGEKSEVARIILTASGGPFYRYSQSKLEAITVADALNHPTWKMGKKVTIDSATLMNKGLETIEAHWLFTIPFDKIEIVVHPKSIIHSLVEFIDGSLKAQLSLPDMHIPIQYALSYPQRLPGSYVPRLDLSTIEALTFAKVDIRQFPCLSLALEAGNKGGTYPTVLCAADEVAVELFLKERILFTEIPEIIDHTLQAHKCIANPCLQDIFTADEWARQTASEIAIKEK